MKQINKSALASAAAVLLMGTAGHGQAAQTIQVTVNGTPVAFSGTPPTEIKGAVLVPLRGVFQALGASVDYNAATRVINAQKGATTVLLPLGSLQATVNGQPQDLSQPAQAVGGTTLVPLRFVAQALGAYVDWHAATSTVEITTQEPHLATLPAPPGQGAVTGQATGIYTDTNPQQITVRVNGKNTSVPISDSTIVVRSVVGQPGIVTPLAQIQPGDQVTIQRGADGAAISITATFGEVAGTVKSIGRLASGNSVVTLNDGTTVELMKGAPVTMNGNPIKLSNVMTDEKVTIRTNPSNNLGLGVAVATGGDPNPVPPGQAIGAETVTPPPGNIAAAGATELVFIASFTHNAT
ncbi:MAG: copper amine oxidase N-terminal domain-containing protein, partial [Armatimonadota bacterium]|nr:copper amine oxidase N-terminal domain-containing protein [Armatimonadota bacterium]